jgi:hypothetical protein
MARKDKLGTGRGKRDPRASDHQDHELDEALDATFPASDPVTVSDETADEPAHASTERRAPLLDVDLVKQLARELKRARKGE